MTRIDYTPGGGSYARLAAAFGIPVNGIVLELNPVLSRLRQALNPLASPEGERTGRVIFLEGFLREGKGAQAYLLARDWLRLSEASVPGLQTCVVFAETAQQLEEATRVETDSHILTIVRQGRRLSASHDFRAALKEMLNRNRRSALVLVKTLFAGKEDRSPEQFFQELEAEGSVGQGPKARWLRMLGIATERLRMHLSGRAEISGVELSVTDLDRLIRLATIEARGSSGDAPRVLLGLLHRALDSAGEESAESRPDEALTHLTREYLENQLADVEAPWELRVRSLVEILAEIGEASGHLEARPPRDLIDALLSERAGCGTSELAGRFPHLLEDSDGAIQLTLRGLLEGWRGAGASLPSTAILPEAREAALSPAARTWLATLHGEPLLVDPHLAGLSEPEGWDIGVLMAHRPSRSENEIAASDELPQAVQGGILFEAIREAEDGAAAGSVAAWGGLLRSGRSSELPRSSLANAARASFESLGGWVAASEAILRKALTVEGSVETTLDPWFEIYLSLARTELESLHGPLRVVDDSEARFQKALQRLSLIPRLTNRIRGRARLEVGERLGDLIVGSLPTADLAEALGRCSLLGDKPGPPTPRGLVGRLPLWPRVQAMHWRILFGDLSMEGYWQWLDEQLDDPSPDALRRDAWVLLEALIQLAGVAPEAAGPDPERFGMLEGRWRASHPAAAYEGLVLIWRDSEEVAEAAAALTHTLEDLGPEVGSVVALQTLFAAVLGASGYASGRKAEAAAADRILEMLGKPAMAEELLSRLRSGAEAASATRRLERDPPLRGPLENRLSEAKRLSRFNKDLDAAHLLGAVLEKRPDHQTARLQLAALYERAGKTRKASDLLEQGIKYAGRSYGLLEALGRCHHAEGEISKALGCERRLAELTFREPKVHRDHLRRVVLLASELGDGDTVLSAGALYMQRFGLDTEVLSSWIDAFKNDEGDEDRPDPDPLLLGLLEALSPRNPVLRIPFLLKLDDPATVRAEVHHLLRDISADDRWALLSVAKKLPEGSDNLLLELISHLRAGNLAQARASLKELEQVAPGRTDLDLFRASVNLGFARSYSRRFMGTMARRHVRLAFQAFVRALWNGYGGPEITRLGAESVAIRLIVSDLPMTIEELAAARELLRANRLERETSVRARELEVHLDTVFFTSNARGVQAEQLRQILDQIEAELLEKITSLLSEHSSSVSAFHGQYQFIDGLVRLAEEMGLPARNAKSTDTQERQRAAIKDLLDHVAEHYLMGEPGRPAEMFYRGWSLLRLAEGRAVAATPARQVIEDLKSASSALEAIDKSPEGGGDSDSSKPKVAGRRGSPLAGRPISAGGGLGDKDRIRLGAILKRLELRSLEFEDELAGALG